MCMWGGHLWPREEGTAFLRTRVGVKEPRPASHDNTNIGAARTASRKGRKLLAGMKSAGRALVMCTKVSTLGPTVTW